MRKSLTIMVLSFIIIGLGGPLPGDRDGGDTELWAFLRQHNGWEWLDLYSAAGTGGFDWEAKRRAMKLTWESEHSTALGTIQAGPTGIRYTGGK